MTNLSELLAKILSENRISLFCEDVLKKSLRMCWKTRNEFTERNFIPSIIEKPMEKEEKLWNIVRNIDSNFYNRRLVSDMFAP